MHSILSPSTASTTRSTTILAVRRGGKLAMIGDGQVSMGPTVVKNNAAKVKKLAAGTILTGFAGATADAFTLLERLEEKLEKHQTHLLRACVELAKDWRMDRYLRRLEALLLVADADGLFLLSGQGDILSPEGDCMAIGSGGHFALAAARALLKHTELNAAAIAEASLHIAADICVYTNKHTVLEVIDHNTSQPVS